MIKTVLRHMRKRSESALTRCFHMIHSLTAPNPLGIARARFRPKFGQAHFGRDCFTTHTKMGGRWPASLSPKDSSTDRSGLPRRCVLVRPTIARPVAIRSRPSSSAWRSGCTMMLARALRGLVECRAGRAVRSSTRSRSRPESAASHSGRGHSATHERMVGKRTLSLFSRDSFADRSKLAWHCLFVMPTKVRSSAFWS